MPYTMSTKPWTIVASILFVLTSSCTRQEWQAPKTGFKRTEKRWIKVQIDASGLKTREIETEIVIPLEQHLSVIPSVAHLQSLSCSGRAGVWARIERQSNFDDSFLEVVRRLQPAVESLSTISEPVFWHVPEGPVLLALIKRKGGEESLESFAARCATAARLASQIERIPHVGFVSCWSSTKLDVAISVNQQRLAEQNFKTQDVLDALAKNAFQFEDGIVGESVSQTLEDTLLDVNIRSRQLAEGHLQLRDVAQICLSTQTVGLEEIGKSKFPAGSILLAIHVESPEHADACSKELETQVSKARQSTGIDITRNFDGQQLPWQEIQVSMTNQLYPPNYIARYASNSDWKSHLTLVPDGIQVRMSGINVVPMQELAPRIRQLLRRDLSSDATTIATIGETTAETIEIEVHHQKLLPGDISPETLRQKLTARLTQYEPVNAQLLASLAQVRLVSESGSTTLPERIGEISRELVSDTSTTIESVCALRVVEEPTEIWRIDQKPAVGLILSSGKGATLKAADVDALLEPIREQSQQQWPGLQIDVTDGS